MGLKQSKKKSGKKAMKDYKQELEEAYEFLKNYTPVKKHSLLKKYLTREVLDALKEKKTKNGATLMDVIRSGVEVPESSIGVYAPDSDAYVVFRELMEPIIAEYHQFDITQKQPELDFGALDKLGDLDPSHDFIISTRIRCARNLDGFGMHPILKEEDYLVLEKRLATALESLDGDLKGKYYPLLGMTEATKKQMVEDHFLFAQDDDCLKSANASNFWPKGRGIYHNEAKTFLVWVNEEDQLRIISMEQGADVKKIYERWSRALTEIEKMVPFARDPRYGYITFCPTNLGTCIRSSVMIKLPKLAKDMTKLNAECEKLGLQVRGMHGEHSDTDQGIFDISNKRRLGLTEFDAVNTMYEGIKKVIEMEKSA